MTTTPQDRFPLPDPDRDRPAVHDLPTGPLASREAHDRTPHGSQRAPDEPNGPVSSPAHHGQPAVPAVTAGGGWGHRLLMLVCCIPMIVSVVALVALVALVASGVAGAGSIIFALLCVGMMAVMMFMMPGDRKR